jgi:hypothetical protein
MQITTQNYKQLTAAQLNKFTSKQIAQYNAVVAAANAAMQKNKKPPYYKQQQTTIMQLAKSIARLQYDMRISSNTKTQYIENMFNSYLQHAHTDKYLLQCINENSTGVVNV